MKAAIIKDKKLIFEKIPIPNKLDANEILIKTHFAGINRADLLQLRGLYDPPQDASNIPGLEVAGEIIELGEDVKNFNIGDMIFCLLDSGGYAEYSICHSALSFKCNDLPLMEAASLPEALYVSWYNLAMQGKTNKGENIFIEGGSSGIGTIMIQIARNILKAGVVITTASNESKAEICYKLGADYVINHRIENWLEEFAKLAQKYEINILIDMFGGEFLSEAINYLAYNGRVISIAAIYGKMANINIGNILRNNLAIKGSTLRDKDINVKALIARELEKHVMDLVYKGEIKPIIDKIFPFNEAENALNYMKTNQHIGKILLDMTKD